MSQSIQLNILKKLLLRNKKSSRLLSAWIALSDNPNLKYQMTNFTREKGADITSKRYSFMSIFAQCEAGYKFIFFNIQYGMYIPIDNELMYPFRPYISMGLTYRFNTKSFPQNNSDQQQ